MITIRDDDVLLSSKGFSDPIARFKKVHRWILEAPKYFKHVPAILVREILQFPEVIELVREEASEGRMFPELHGLQHIDYGSIEQKEIEEHLDLCVEWMLRKLNVRPCKFYTPWGTSSIHPPIAEACKIYGLIPVDTSKTMKPRDALVLAKREGVNAPLHDREILIHWWEGGLRIPRIIKIFAYGGYKEAKKAEPELYQ